jgi:glucan phosphoethanolaminetransferase (alkaline phosphatase superfamily)
MLAKGLPLTLYAHKKRGEIRVAKKRMESAQLLGSWSFLVGVVLAVLLGLGLTGPYQATMLWVVFLLGIIVGLLNITHDEVSGFLTSGTVLALMAFLGVQVGVFDAVAPIIGNILRGILTLFVPATIIVALKAVFVLARR